MPSVVFQNVKALEIWTVQSLYDIGIILSIISLLLHLGRPYFERILARLPLRVAADIWWVFYVVMRDGSLFGAMILGFWGLNLDLMADIKIGLPFCPFGTVFLSAALLVKVFYNSEDLTRAYRLASGLVLVGTLLNAYGWIFIMETAGDEYAVAKQSFWMTMKSWRSNLNPAMATWVFYVAAAGMVVLLAIACVKGFRAMAASPMVSHIAVNPLRAAENAVHEEKSVRV